VGASAAAPSETAAAKASESLRNIVVSSSLGARCANGSDDEKPRPGRLNESGTAVSDRVHFGEIVVILYAAHRSEAAHFLDIASLAVSGRHRYKPATSIGAFSRVKIMAIERTFSIIKPDATARNLTGAVNALIEKAGLRIVAQKRIRMTREQAETFYSVHKARPFFGELVEFMTSGPVVVQVLEGENAVLKYRDVMGATDPSKAAEGTIRKIHAKSIGENSVHGSDAQETAAIEIAQFFSGNEIVG
jgi:nucleoside-diphosphate kinase